MVYLAPIETLAVETKSLEVAAQLTIRVHSLPESLLPLRKVRVERLRLLDVKLGANLIKQASQLQRVAVAVH